MTNVISLHMLQCYVIFPPPPQNTTLLRTCSAEWKNDWKTIYKNDVIEQNVQTTLSPLQTLTMLIIFLLPGRDF